MSGITAFRQSPNLSIIVPCYNEEEVLLTTTQALKTILNTMIESGDISPDSHICFVNDGSKDKTWDIILAEINKPTSMCRGINLSRNFGHQAAVLAGLFTDKADVYITIDADLQDDETKILDMISLFNNGYDIVYGCRNNRSTDTWFKRTSAQFFYKVREKLGCHTIPNHADYRLMSARTIEALKEFGEANIYLRGVVPLLGFPSTCIFYSRKSRQLGESKYPLKKMIQLAWNGVANFSSIPLQLCLWIGGIGILTSLFFILYSIIQWNIGKTLPGWTSTVLIISSLMSMQFLFTGIVGLYIGNIFQETKGRPRYIVQDDMTKH